MLTVSWWHGGDWPEPGDFLRTTGGSCYHVLRVRGKTRPTAIVARKVKQSDIPEDGTVHEWEWKKREKSRQGRPR